MPYYSKQTYSKGWSTVQYNKQISNWFDYANIHKNEAAKESWLIVWWFSVREILSGIRILLWWSLMILIRAFILHNILILFIDFRRFQDRGGDCLLGLDMDRMVRPGLDIGLHIDLKGCKRLRFLLFSSNVNSYFASNISQGSSKTSFFKPSRPFWYAIDCSETSEQKLHVSSIP